MDFRRAFAYSPLVVVDFCRARNVDFRGLSCYRSYNGPENVDFRGLYSACLGVLMAGVVDLCSLKRGLSWTRASTYITIGFCTPFTCILDTRHGSGNCLENTIPNRVPYSDGFLIEPLIGISTLLWYYKPLRDAWQVSMYCIFVICS